MLRSQRESFLNCSISSVQAALRHASVFPLGTRSTRPAGLPPAAHPARGDRCSIHPGASHPTGVRRPIRPLDPASRRGTRTGGSHRLSCQRACRRVLRQVRRTHQPSTSEEAARGPASGRGAVVAGGSGPGEKQRAGAGRGPGESVPVQLETRRERSPLRRSTYPTIREKPIVTHSSKHPLAVLVVTPLALALAAASAQAATRVDLQKQDVAALNSQYAQASVAIGVSKQANLRHAELLSLGADSALSLVKAREIEDGARNYRYTQTWNGIPVFGEQ